MENSVTKIAAVVMLFLTLAARGCGDGGPAREADGADIGEDAFDLEGEVVQDLDHDESTVGPEIDDAQDAPDEDSGALPRFPIIFVHGNRGGLEDWRDTVSWLVEEDGRWDGSIEAGTENFRDWRPGSIEPSMWLFSFTYYNEQPGDPRGGFTAGPGTIGSNFRFWCNRYENWGRLPADSASYYNGVAHEYSADLHDFVDAVIEATGAEKVDMVAHSMGGLVSRSCIQFHEGFLRVRRLMLVSSPMHGVSLVDLSPIDPTMPRWMIDHEMTELDDAISSWDIGFFNCDEEAPVMAWHEGLNRTDGQAAEHVTYYVIIGGDDPVLSIEDVEYRFAEWQVVIPGADHNTVRDSPDLRMLIREHLGS